MEELLVTVPKDYVMRIRKMRKGDRLTVKSNRLPTLSEQQDFLYGVSKVARKKRFDLTARATIFGRGRITIYCIVSGQAKTLK